MKIHRIETVNLNSLYGTHKIDLDATLEGASLFLIFGPTGSGKSTLMDAVSLALFGKTPRLDAEHGNEAADPRAIMSRGTGECSATVVFSKLEGGSRQTYRASWTGRRSHKKPDGSWRPTERSLERRAADGSWKLIVSSTKRKEYDPAFDKVLEGFGVGDFNRSMLLAQGQFDAFLGAPAEQRAEILERLTDTALYQRLGDRASRMRGRHETRLKALRTLAAAGGGLDPEALAELEAARANNEQVFEQRKRELEQAELHRVWFDTSQDHQRKLTEAMAEKTEHEEKAAEAADDLARLAEHERCDEKKAFGALDTLTIAKKEVTDLEKQLSEIDELLPNLVKIATLKATEAGAASARKTQATAHLESLRPLVHSAEKAEAAQTGSVTIAARTAEELGDAARRVAEAEEGLAGAKAAEAEATRKAEEARADLAAHAGDENLAAQWEPLRTRLTAHITTSDALAEAARDLAGRDASVTEDRDTLALDLASHEQGQVGALAPARDLLERTEAALAALLTEPDFDASRIRAQQAIGTARAKENLVQKAEAPVKAARDGAASLRQARKELEEQAEKSTKALARWSEQEQETKQKAELETAALAALEQIRRVAGLVEYRGALVDGQACPLCGSEEHPWAGDSERAVADAAINETVAAAERSHEEAKHAHGDAKKAYADAEKSRTELDATTKLLKKQSAVLADKQIALDQEAAEALTAAGVPTDTTLASVEEAIRLGSDDLQTKEKTLENLDEAKQKRDRASEGLRKAAEAQQEQAGRLLERQTKLQERKEQLGKDLTQHGKAMEDLVKERGACRTQLQGLGLLLEGDDPTKWRDLGDHNRDRHQARLAAVGEHAGQVEVARKGLEGRKNVLTERTNQRDVLAQKLQSEESDRDEKAALAATARESLDEAWRQVIGADAERPSEDIPAADSDPAALLAAQEAWCKHLDGASQEALEADKETQRALNDTQTRRNTVAAEQPKRQDALKQARAALDAARAMLALPDDAALKERRLGDDELAVLRDRKRELANQKTRVAARLQERHQQIADHRKTRPASLPEQPNTEELANAIAEAKELHQEAEDARQKTGGRLVAHHQAVREQEANRQRLVEAEKDARVWQALHDLIGVNDGGRFKQFAQALNLGQLLDRANVHLARLAKRYRLIPRLEDDLPTLEFDLSDLWQAGERVAPRSLSGGERFLVSLSLALGLSDFRAVKMPIETLLLDEGFGTLDPDTLSVALGALSQLQADGRQVGIISHVVGLRERIEARIEVKPLGGGRSEVRING